MKLVLPVPPAWEHRDVEDGVLYQSPGQTFGMLVTPLGPAPLDPETWIEKAFSYRTHEGDGEPSDLQLDRRVTLDGWGVILLEGKLGIQGRLVAYVACLDYSATVIGMCRDEAKEPTWRSQVLELVAQARPDFSGEGVVSLALMLGGRPPAPTSSRTRPAMAGWHRTFVGGDLVLTGNDGPKAGTIRISPRLTPLLSVPDIFYAFLAPPAADVTVERPTIEHTDEGEYAAIANAITPTEQHTMAVVFADDHYTMIQAAVRDREQFGKFATAVRELTLATTLGLGAGRWRRFYYEAPPGWIGVARPQGALWISPACPRQHQVMRVFEARPPADHEGLHGARTFETLPMEFYRTQPKGPVSYWTADDLECQVTVHTGWLPNRDTPIRVLDGMIKTTHYVYPIRMECDESRFEDSMHAFERVVASFRPVPERRNVDVDAGTAVEFWVG